MKPNTKAQGGKGQNFHKTKSIKSKKTDHQKDNELDPKMLNTAFNKLYQDYSNCIVSQKPLMFVKSYACNTYKGISREVNEDRAIVVHPILKPENTNVKTWPNLGYFAIFDGHGGESIAEYLKNNFLDCLLKNKNFPTEIKLALTQSFEKIEEDIFQLNKNKSINEIDRTGSCALIAIITDTKIYIANLGDSRAIMSINQGSKAIQLTVDHKPNNLKEYERVIKAGGKIYVEDEYPEDESGKYNEDDLKFINNKSDFDKYKNDKEVLYRHYPSDLSIVRALGDLHIKRKEFGGQPKGIIGVPEIFEFDHSQRNDFIIMGSDGIFDFNTNEQIMNAAWYIFKNKATINNYDLNELTKDACNMIIKYAMEVLNTDNLSCIVIGLEGLQKDIGTTKYKSQK